MDNVWISLEKSNVLTNLGALCCGHFFFLSVAPFLIRSSKEPNEDVHTHLEEGLEECIDDHCLSQCVANVNIPFRTIIIERTERNWRLTKQEGSQY